MSKGNLETLFRIPFWAGIQCLEPLAKMDCFKCSGVAARGDAKCWKTFARLLLRPLRGGWPDEGRRIIQEPPLKHLLRCVAPVRIVLNAGAGEGLFSAALLGKTGLLHLVEMDSSYTHYARASIDSRQSIIGASLTAIPVRSSTFDLVLCTEVLEHIENDAAALDEIRRVLAPKGWLLITVPTPPAVYDPNHVREGYSAEHLGGMLRARDFKIIDTAFCMHAGFKTTMRVWRRCGWMPRVSIWCLALADVLCPIGPPMDLMILSQVA
jgi:SAM-dependent methyltransferase